jgi:hypothetical protein
MRPSWENVSMSDHVTQWLFAFDAAGMATFRTLALMAVHPGVQSRMRDEISSCDPAHHANLPFVLPKGG